MENPNLQRDKLRELHKESNWQDYRDVSFSDLNFFLKVARTKKDAEAFDTAVDVLKRLKKQVTGKD